MQREPRRPSPDDYPPPEPMPRTGAATLLELEAALRYDPAELSEALAEQPTMFYQVAKRLAVAISEQDTIKLELDDLKAKVSLDAHASAGEEKLTVEKAKSIVRLHPAVHRLTLKLNEVEQSVGELTALKEAFIQRGYSLRTEGELQTRSGSANEIADIKASLQAQREAARRTR